MAPLGAGASGSSRSTPCFLDVIAGRSGHESFSRRGTCRARKRVGRSKERLRDWQPPLEQLCCVSRDCDVAGQRGHGNLSDFHHTHRSLRLKVSDGTFECRMSAMAIGIGEHPLSIEVLVTQVVGTASITKPTLASFGSSFRRGGAP